MTSNFEFVLTLAGSDELTPELADALFEAGCDDATLHSDGPVLYIDFDREAVSLGDAIGSAVKDVEKAGFKVSRVEVETQSQSPAAAG